MVRVFGCLGLKDGFEGQTLVSLLPTVLLSMLSEQTSASLIAALVTTSRANVDIRNGAGQTPLHFAFSAGRLGE